MPLFVTGPYALGIILVSIYFAIIALAWNLLAGYAGQFSLAPAAFAMIGAYTTALLDYYWQVPLAIGIPAAIVGTALLGWVLGKLVLQAQAARTSSLTTLAFAEIARVVIGNSHEFTRGDQGMHVADADAKPRRLLLHLPGDAASPSSPCCTRCCAAGSAAS